MNPDALVRRRRARAKEPTLRLITFQLRHHWFCLPLGVARRALPQQASSGANVGLIEVQDQAIPVVDAATLVYGRAMPQLPGQADPQPPAAIAQVQSILVVETSQQGPLGLMVDGTPTIKRVGQSAFKPVPPVYLTMHGLRGISSVVDLKPLKSGDSTQAIFLLDVEGLLHHL